MKITSGKNLYKFAKKIIYLVYDKVPQKIEVIKPEDAEDEKSRKYISNAYLRENGQRNYIVEGLNNAVQNDIILVSDVDEIPNLSKIDLRKTEDELIFFKQDMIYYKFNLKLNINCKYFF